MPSKKSLEAVPGRFHWIYECTSFLSSSRKIAGVCGKDLVVIVARLSIVLMEFCNDDDVIWAWKKEKKRKEP